MPVSHYRELLNFCLRLTKDREVAAEALQESYMRVLSASSEAIEYPRAFLRQIALNVMRDHWREEKRRQRIFVEPQADSDFEADASGIESQAPSCWQPEKRLEARQELDCLSKVIDGLPERQREAFLLYRIEHLSHEEIALKMGISVRMVEKHVQLAMLQCKRELQKSPSRQQSHEAT